jgi:hypothetical protein
VPNWCDQAAQADVLAVFGARPGHRDHSVRSS